MQVSKDQEKISRRKFLDRSLRVSAAAAAAAILPAFTTGCTQGASGPYDLLIRNGTLYDGVANQPFVADIGVKGDTIVFIGKIDEPCDRVIDAAGKAVMPGFIDVHTHCDLTFIKSGWQRHLARVMPSWKGNHNYLGQGVTTVVTGNCGWGYERIDTWFDLLDSLDFGTNVYHLAPHGVIREALFGRNQPRELSRSQMALFKKRLEEELDRGAVGFSSGLEYAPGFLAPKEELIELARVAARYKRVYATHIRNESGAIDPNTGKVLAAQSIEEAVAVGLAAEIPVQISHLKISAPVMGHDASLVLEPIEDARARGVAVTADQYPYDAGSTIISVLLPHGLKEGEGVKEEFKTRAGRETVKAEITKVFSDLGPEKILITMHRENESNEGKTLQEIADLSNKSPAEVYADLVCEDPVPVGVFFGQEMAVVREIMARDYILTGSDGWTVPKDMTRPHPRTYGTFPRKLGQFCRKEGIVDLGTCIRSMTSLPAEVFGMTGRGRLAAGCFADIVILDLDRVKDPATYLDPHRYATGVAHVIVNGKVALANGRFTGERGGRTQRV